MAASSDRRKTDTGLDLAQILSRLLAQGDYYLKGMIADAIAALGVEYPDLVDDILAQLEQSNEEIPNLVVLEVALELELLEHIIAIGTQSSNALARNLASEYLYRLWQKNPSQGEQALFLLANLARRDVRKILTMIAKAFVRGSNDVLRRKRSIAEAIRVNQRQVIEEIFSEAGAIQCFLNTFVWFATSGQGIPDVLKGAYLQLLGPIRWIYGIASKVLGLVWGKVLYNVWSSGELIGINSLVPFFACPIPHDVSLPQPGTLTYSLEQLEAMVENRDIWRKYARQLAAEMAAFLDTDMGSIAQVRDEILAVSRMRDGMFSLLIEGICISHLALDVEEEERDLTWNLLADMISIGDEFAANTAGRTMCVALAGLPDPLPDFPLRIIEEKVLSMWTPSRSHRIWFWAGNPDTKDEYIIEMRPDRYNSGFFWPLLFECRKRQSGQLEFVNRVLRSPWHEQNEERTLALILALKMVGLEYPLQALQALERWFDTENTEIRNTLIEALAHIRTAFPDEVEFYLSDFQRLAIEVKSYQERHAEKLRVYVRGQVGLSHMCRDAETRKEIASCLQRISLRARNVQEALNMLATRLFNPNIAIWRQSSQNREIG